MIATPFRVTVDDLALFEEDHLAGVRRIAGTSRRDEVLAIAEPDDQRRRILRGDERARLARRS